MPLIDTISAAIGSRLKRHNFAPLHINEVEGSTSGAQITQSNVSNFTVKAVGNVNEGADGNFTSSSYSLSEIKRAIEADSYIKLAVMKYSQLIFKAGYNLVSDNDEAAKYIRARFRMMGFMTGTPMDVTFQQIADDLVAYSNAFLVKSRISQTNIGGLQAKGLYDTKPVGGYFRLDPTSVEIKVDKNGTIKQYQQTAGQNTANFKPTDVIHIFIDKQGGELFGTPRIIAAMEDVKLLRKIEGNVLTLIYRFAIPLYQMKIGLPEQGFRATDKEISDAKSEVEKLASDGILVTNEATEFKSIGAEGEALDATGYLQYFEKRVIAGLNLSEAMIGRGGAKSDASSMEEMIHDCVKRYQHAIQIFVEEKIINELLLEGGFNPLANENDIVHFQFNEINLETKVKMQTNALNKFQGNLITYEEARQEIGMETDDVNEDRLYQNMIKTPANIALVKAKLGTSSNTSVSANTGVSGPDKTTDSGSEKITASIVQPSNKYGSTTMKVKESIDNKLGKTKKNIEEYKKKYPEIAKRYLEVRNDIIERGIKARSALPIARDGLIEEFRKVTEIKASSGIRRAFSEAGSNSTDFRKISLTLINENVADMLDRMFKDIAKRLDKSSSKEERAAAFDAIEYRLRFLCESILVKAYWFGYVKACQQLGIKKVYVDFGKSNDKKEHKSVINTRNFSLEDIPAFHAYCTCKLYIRNKGGD